MLALAIALALAAGGGSADPNAWDGHSFRRYADATSHLAIELPLTQTLVESRHFGHDVAPGQATDVLLISGPNGFELELDVFDRRDSNSLDAFIDSHLQFLRTSDRTELNWTASHGKLAAKLIEHPRRPGQFHRRTALVAHGDQIFRLTCFDADDARSVNAFEHALDSLEVLP